MAEYAAARIGTRYSFPVTGNKDAAPVYGDNPYAINSDLRAAAVHAGVLAHGETGVIAVELVATPQPRQPVLRPGQSPPDTPLVSRYAGTVRNGVVSAYSTSGVGYRLLAGNTNVTTLKGAELTVSANVVLTSLGATQTLPLFPTYATNMSAIGGAGSATPNGGRIALNYRETVIAPGTRYAGTTAIEHNQDTCPVFRYERGRICGVDIFVQNGVAAKSVFTPTLAYRSFYGFTKRTGAATDKQVVSGGKWVEISADTAPFATWVAVRATSDGFASPFTNYSPRFTTLLTLPAPGRQIRLKYDATTTLTNSVGQTTSYDIYTLRETITAPNLQGSTLSQVEWFRPWATWPFDGLTYNLGPQATIGKPIDVGTIPTNPWAPSALLRNENGAYGSLARQYRLTLPQELGGYNLYWIMTA
jgi:hypothetical protein